LQFFANNEAIIGQNQQRKRVDLMKKTKTVPTPAFNAVWVFIWVGIV
jgi:hypothetical protein